MSYQKHDEKENKKDDVTDISYGSELNSSDEETVSANDRQNINDEFSIHIPKGNARMLNDIDSVKRICLMFANLVENVTMRYLITTLLNNLGTSTTLCKYENI